MSRPRAWLVAGIAAVAVVVVVLLLASSSAGQRPVSRPTADAPAWTTFSAEVVGVRRVDERTAIVEVELPAGQPDCARDLRVAAIEDQLPDRPTVIYANVVFSSAATGACPDRATAEVTLAVAEPLNDRTLMFNSMQPVWAPEGERYRECDEHLGCHPPADHYDPAWVERAVYLMDVPVDNIGAVYETLACDGNWLVLELNRAAGTCPPMEGAPRCTVPDETRRLFLYFGQYGWDSVASTRDAGCAAVHAERSEFPVALCQTLPPVQLP